VVAPASHPRRQARPLVAAAVVLLALNFRTVIASLPPLLGTVRADLGLSGTAAGLLTTLPVLLFGALAPLVPRLARRVPLERVVVGCAALTAVAAAARGIGTVPALFAASLLAGASVSVGQAALPVLIRIRWPASTGRLTGAYSLALTSGALLAALAAVPLERALGDSWQASLASWAVPAAIAAAAWSGVARRGGTLVHGDAPPALRAEPLAWAVAIYFGVQSAGFYAGLTWLPEILEANGWSTAAAGALQALAAAASLAPALLVPIVAARRSGQHRILVVVAAAATAGVLGILVAPGGAIAWMALIGFGQGGMLGLGLILPALRGGSAAVVASLTAMMFCAGYLISATGPWILGLLHDLSAGWTAPLVAMLVITLLQLVPGAFACRPRTLGGD
jgi:MFS transporter, CP family, cyanate transporter